MIARIENCGKTINELYSELCTEYSIDRIPN